MSEQKGSLFHIIMWNYRDDVPEDERDRLEADLLELQQKIPTLKGVHAGPVTGGRNQSYSHCFVMLFDDQAGLDAYTRHPEHERFASSFRAACVVQVVVDFSG